MLRNMNQIAKTGVHIAGEKVAVWLPTTKALSAVGCHKHPASPYIH